MKTLFNNTKKFRILRRPEVLELTGWSKSTLYNRIKDGLIPPPISLGLRSIGFNSLEIYSTLDALCQEQSPEQIKTLVSDLVLQRKNGSYGRQDG
jgi:prophage regulatory protein